MRLDHLEYHLNRRQLLGGAAKLGAAGAAASALSGGLLAGAAGASTATTRSVSQNGSPGDPGDYDDSFSIEGALNGEWAAHSAARYGGDDQRGTLNEITPAKTAAALQLLAGADAVATYNMGHLMVNGIPAFVTYPPRRYEQRLYGYGVTPTGDYFTTKTRGFEGEDEWRRADRERGPLWYWGDQGAFGPNILSSFEERFPEGTTYQIATQFDNLNHVGVGDIYYNGFLAPDFVAPHGTTKLGMEHVGPFVTRGVLLDVLGWKQSTGSSDVITVGGNQMLSDNYRITLEDLLETMAWEGVSGLEPGDAIVIRTGFHKLAEDPATHPRYLAGEPGIYVREGKWLADHRPALVASDTFGLEVLGGPVLGPALFPVHQWLLVRDGIRIGEGVISDGLAAAGAYEFVYSYSPQHALGATAGNVPPMGLAPAP